MTEPFKVPEIIKPIYKPRRTDNFRSYHTDEGFLDKYLFTSKGKSWKQIEKLIKFGNDELAQNG